LGNARIITSAENKNDRTIVAAIQRSQCTPVALRYVAAHQRFVAIVNDPDISVTIAKGKPASLCAAVF
jgi:hypothetical protein